MRVLDLGCGFGTELSHCGVTSSDSVVGIDLAFERLVVAAGKFSQRRFVQAQGEALPFRSQVFQSVICQVALPYMNIPAALQEASRVLEPGGSLQLSLHPLRFTLHELTIAFPRPKALLFRVWVIVNGFILHFTGKPAGIRGRYESFQTCRGITTALRRAGFENISFSRPASRFGPRVLMKAIKL